MPPISLARRKIWTQAGLLFLITLALWLPRGLGLDRFVATDEVAWLWRSANFYYALGQRDPASTGVNRSPGVVTMWVNTAAFLVEFPEYRGFGQGLLNKYSLLETFLERHAVDPHAILVTGRALMVVLNTLVLAVAFYFSRRLLGTLSTVIGFLLVAFDPYHIALTRLAHLDGPLSSFIFLSLLAFMAYLYRPADGLWTRRTALLVSAAAAALAVLSKIPGLLLLPTIGLLWLHEVWRSPHAPQLPASKRLIHGLVQPMLVWGSVFAFTLVLFFPAMWVNPAQTVFRLVESPFRFASEANRDANAIGAQSPAKPFDQSGGLGDTETTGDIQVASRSSSRPLEYFIRYPEKYLWHSTPLVLLGLVAAAAAWLLRKTPFDQTPARKAAAGMLLFVIIYTVIMTIPPKSSSKYYLPVYPVLALIAGAGWYALSAWVTSGLITAPRRWVTAGLLVAVVGLQVSQALPVYPYFLTYINPLMAANAKARANLALGSGEGLDQAAAYLNQKPGAETLKVMSWYGIGPFSYFFDGQTTALVPGARPWDAQSAARLQNMDYLVVYSSQWRRQIPGGLFPFIGDTKPEHRIFLNGIEYVRIFNVDDFPVEKFLETP